jgi:hypothetical protein
MNVGSYRKSDSRKQVGSQLTLINSASFGQTQPSFDSTLFSSLAVVVDYSMQPDSPHFAQRTVAEDSGIFERDVLLIEEAIRHPHPYGLGRKFPCVHPLMKRMEVMIFSLSDLM